MSTVMERRGTWMDGVNALPEIGLDELRDEAELLQRVDRKYVLEPEDLEELVERMSDDGARALQIGGIREFSYVSDYYDTPGLALYRDAATGRRRRFKLRKRVYVDSGLQFLELKTRGPRSLNVKDRLELGYVGSGDYVRTANGQVQGASEPIATSDPLYSDPVAFQWVGHRLAERGIAADPGSAVAMIGGLAPVLRSVYRRATLLTCDGSRITIDSDLRLTPFEGAVGDGITVQATGSGATPTVPIIVETKSAGGISDADRFLWHQGIRPSRVSKYALGIAQSYRVPANRWTRTLKAVGVTS